MQLGANEKDPVRIVDWAELQILYSGDSKFNLESLKSEADMEGLETEEDEPDMAAFPNEQNSPLLWQTVAEITRRTAHGGDGYPFRVNGEVLELKPRIPRLTPYAFCLMVCDRDYWYEGDPSSRMFEHIALNALIAYLQGDGFRFGAPRDASEQAIKIALLQLSERTGDPLISVFPVKNTDKDLGLDLVAWKNFVDQRASKVLVYMQCATGNNWYSKRGDLDLSIGGVWNQILGWTTPPIKGMAIPYVIPSGIEWQRATPGMLLMDRLRIASLLPPKAIRTAGFRWRKWYFERVSEAKKSRNS